MANPRKAKVSGKTESKNTPETKESKKATPFIPVIAVVEPSGKPFVSSSALPDGRHVCMDEKGDLTVISNPDTKPKKIATGIPNAELTWLAENKIIAVDPHHSAFILNIDTEEKTELDRDFAHSGLSVAILKSDEKEYLFVVNNEDYVVKIYAMNALDKPIDVISVEEANAKATRLAWPSETFYGTNNLTVVGDSVVVGIGRSIIGYLMVISMQGGKESHQKYHYSDGSGLEGGGVLVFGGKEFLAVAKKKLCFGVLNERMEQTPGVTKQCFKPMFSIADFRYKGISRFPGTDIFGVIDLNGEKVTIVHCKSGQRITSTLPLPFKSGLTFTEDGRISYFSDKNQFVVLQTPYVRDQKLKDEADSFLSAHIHRGPANIVKAYLDDRTGIVPILTKESIVAAIAMIGLKQNRRTGLLIEPKFEKEQKDKLTLPFFSKSDYASHSAAINAMLCAENDEERYHLAKEFAANYPENPLAKILESLLTEHARQVSRPKA
ncbi:MAG: hypothetical protein ACYCQI_15800 [Gammaproteobacteria bacterium]